ncbi:UbiX family flavin prenyltransferase [Oceanispirochaeta sp.]|jgi:4-hydroxy-3-polyprenylbenzoate decarboxylase|uniref:UbiX family flavin prenyltransferase n=1 Tax=Oceanispirochaeta sp. TaxID=2035350 RepID=UPI0026192BEA|nr:UbiX family flavin prenyltransferase [Oceanispirochaeta sp.]MDA3956749.1 UbiX family flavin prenyltransferase [Oceanispirochaeta sp.]
MVPDSPPLILALTGASGSLYSLSLARKILQRDIPLHLLISDTAAEILRKETGRRLDDWVGELTSMGKVMVDDIRNLGASVSSGSYLTRGMIVAPCSMGTLGRIAAGVSGNLIERAADVCLKERRKLILLARETPLSAIHLENMLRISHAGGIIMPPVPALYAAPASIGEMVDFTAERVMDLMELPSPEAYRWDGGGWSGDD